MKADKDLLKPIREIFIEQLKKGEEINKQDIQKKLHEFVLNIIEED